MERNPNELGDDCSSAEVAEITTISLNTSSIALDSTVDSSIEELPISAVTVSDSGSEENNETVNGIEINDSVISIDDGGDENEESAKLLFDVSFNDRETFDELSTVVSTKIRDALFKLEKSVTVKIDRAANRIEFLQHNKNDVFMIDTLPTEKKDNAEVPSYEKVTEILLNLEAKANLIAGEASRSSRNGCWNCGGDHNLRDCKEPRNMANINRAKQLFSKFKTERYHVDAEQRYAQYAPGVISDDLRQALGLRRKELPLYLYKMRLYGYPPGWLEEAKISHSGLSLFTSEKAELPDTEREDGEVDKVTFDSNKFISYPGFNAPLPHGYIDDSNYYGVPPMQYQHSKEGLMNFLAENLAKSYKRKKLKLLSTEKPSSNASNDPEDMDVASESESHSPKPSPHEQANSNQEESSNQAKNGDKNTHAGLSHDDVSLTDLEKQKQELLEALDEPSFRNEVDECNIPGGATSTPTIGLSKVALTGTPLLKSVSPYGKLPVGNKWSAGVSDVIDFENLPDATGTYKKLSGVIDKVRNIVKEINERNDAEDEDL